MAADDKIGNGNKSRLLSSLCKLTKESTFNIFIYQDIVVCYNSPLVLFSETRFFAALFFMICHYLSYTKKNAKLWRSRLVPTPSSLCFP